jgi:hypothetical protein
MTKEIKYNEQDLKVLWSHPTESGVGDRLCDLLLLYSYVSIFDAELHFQWPQFPMKDIDVKHREEDIKLENVSEYIKMPEKIFANSPLNPSNDGNVCVFDRYIGGGFSVEEFYNKYVQKQVSLNQYKNSVRNVSTRFRFHNKKIIDHLSKTPKEFIAFHIRRGDKVREGTRNDGNYINTVELDHLDDITKKSIDFYSNPDTNTFFICGDEDKKNQPFIDYARSKQNKVFTSPDVPKWMGTYFDLAVLSKAKKIITSQRGSSFSRFASFLGQSEFLTVYQLEKQGVL